MRISTSISEAMVPSRKLGEEILLQAEEFKYLRVLFTSEQRIEGKADKWIGSPSAVIQTLYIVMRGELSLKAKLSPPW